MGTKIRPINLHTSVDTHIQGLIDSSFVQSRSSAGTDSASTQAMIDSNFANMNVDLHMQDNKKITFGTDSDLFIQHTGSVANIINTTGNLIIADTSGNVNIQGKYGEQSIVANDDGSVELYNDNAKKLETTAYGATVTGTINADSATISGPLKVNVDADASAEIGRAHVGFIGYSNMAGFSHILQNGTSTYSLLQGSNGKTYVNSVSGQTIDLRIQNTTKLSVSDSGAGVLGNLTVNDKMQIRPNATSSEIYEIAIDSADTGSFTGLDFKMDNNLIQRFSTGGSGQLVQFHKDVYLENGTKLYFDGSTDDTNHTQLTVQNPTADRTITLPNMTGSIKELLISEGSMNASELVFNSGTVTTEYSELRLVLSNVFPSSNGQTVNLRVGSGNSQDTGSNYGQAIYYSGYYGSTSAYSINTVNANQSLFYLATGYAALGTGTGQNGHFEITFLNPNTSSRYKLFKINSQIYSYYPMLMGRYIDAAVWKSTAAINYIRVYPSTGNLALEYKLYGVKS